MRVRNCIVGSALTLTTAVLSAGCAAGGTASPPSSGSGAARLGPSPGSLAAAIAGASAGCDRTAWRSAPVTVTRTVSVPPVPVLADVRTAQHSECGYDRLVLDISGPMPSYAVRYVNRVTADASGAAITLPGRRYLLITLRSAQAHSEAGVSTISRNIRVPGYPSLRSWVLAGDSEGVVTVAVGLPAQVSIRTGELPGHLYIDFRE